MYLIKELHVNSNSDNRANRFYFITLQSSKMRLMLFEKMAYIGFTQEFMER